ncbi:hypothetical protein K435DRAFT_771488 [Dendrothele bispora CBS 962.96]|uniref:Heterokaryon incompatibility domain-containing protein n=1 Tax=Dendrothele bispora (strain CBS 962.96) TaxID=1314807 RepID=A0A4S8KJT8_DENBC|nr:hypothetical protein K435DRAFT_771488 [Dendrothele bispora CBS 962.96]
MILQCSGIPKIVESSWFQRGWTVQELVAPTLVIFFDAKWTPFGDRHSLGRIIAEATGIRRDVLSGVTPLEDIRVEERFCWSVGRVTTVPEDRAYCLLGLLNVQMELYENEGEETAFDRLGGVLRTQYAGSEQIRFLEHATDGKSIIACLADVRESLQTAERFGRFFPFKGWPAWSLKFDRRTSKRVGSSYIEF